MDLELNLHKVREGNRLMDRIKKLMVAREDLRMRNEKMQIYEVPYKCCRYSGGE